jgi:uncharacterized membrane protein
MSGIQKSWLFLAVLAIALAPLGAPLLSANHPVAAWVIRSFFSRLCHQNPARSFVMDGSPVAVCVRCLGIYFGCVIGPIVRMGRIAALRCLALALLLNLLDVASEMLLWHGNLPLTRFSMGLVLGVGAGAVIFLPNELWVSVE